MSISEERRLLRPMLATGILHPLTAGGTAVPAEVIYAAATNPVSGPRALVRALLDDVSSRIDWSQR